MRMLQRAQRFWESIRRGETIRPIAVCVEPRHVLDLGKRRGINKDRSYVQIRVNELFLQYSREWYRRYDPMMFVVTELIYGREEMAIPFVVGPEILRKYERGTPEGMLFQNTRVAGPYPYRGGRIAVTAVLYKVERANYAAAMLRSLERFGQVVPYWSNVNRYVELGEALFNAIDDMLALGGVIPVVGQRFELDPDAGDTIEPGFYVLIDAPPQNVETENLWVKQNRLLLGKDRDAAGRLSGVDFALYSLVGSEVRNDERVLPFYGLYEQAQAAAAAPGEDSWERAKALLATLYQQLILSSDLTPGQARDLAATYRDWLKDLHAGRRSIEVLGAARGAGDDESLRRALDRGTAEILAL